MILSFVVVAIANLDLVVCECRFDGFEIIHRFDVDNLTFVFGANLCDQPTIIFN
jgi:hypothetical protein